LEVNSSFSCVCREHTYLPLPSSRAWPCAVGLKGSSGDPGEVGDVGWIGMKGEQGGEEGQKGMQGPQGKAFTGFFQ